MRSLPVRSTWQPAPMRRLPFALLLCALVLPLLMMTAARCSAQQAAARPFRTERISIDAASLTSSSSYRLDVHLPPEYDTARDSLPVLYYLDAWWWGELLPSLVRMSALASPPRTSPVILVGIRVDGHADDFNRARNRDFTPSPHRAVTPGVTIKTGNVVLDSAGTGGAGAFLEFLEQDIIPTVERRYRTLPNARGLAGHSYGGLFAVWCMSQRPDLFSRYLLVSPSTYWNDREALEALEALELNAGRSSVAGRRVFVAVGGREMAIMTRATDELVKVLQSQRGTEIREQRYAGADHLTVLPSALLDGFLFLYGTKE